MIVYRCVPLLAIALASLVLCLLPPTRLLGYEYAWVTAILFATLFATTLRNRSRLNVAAAIVLPLAFGVGNALFVKNCNLQEGVLWYAILTVPQAIFAVVLARVVPRALYYMCVVAAAVGMIAGPLIGPSMRAYSLLLGFFAGSLYDEALPIPTALYWHQAMTLLVAYALWAWRFDFRPGRAFLAGIVALGIYGEGRAFGFRVTYEDLRAALPRTIMTEHLVLHFPAGGTIERRIGEVWPEAERTAITIAHRVAAGDEAIEQRLRDEPTHVYVYESTEVKERLLGAKHTQFARPWRPEVHVVAADITLPSLAHELVHTFARTWTSGPFYVPARAAVVPNMGLTEGVAVALADEGDTALYESMAALKKLGKLPDLRSLLGAGFYADSGARAYTATGAFVAWLIETRGADVVKKAYAAGALGFDDALIEEYLAFLAAQPVDDLTARAYADQFKERPLYARTCGREIAKKKAEAQRFIDGGRFDDAEGVYRAMQADDPGDSSVAIAILDLDRRRAPQSPAAAARHEAGLRALIAAESTSEPQRVRLTEQLGDRLLARGADASEAYAAAKAKATRPEDVRRLALKLQLLDRPDAAAMVSAIDGSTEAPRAVAILMEAFHRTPEDAVVLYLLARRLALSGDLPRAYVYGTTVTIAELPAEARFEAARMRAEWAIRLRLPVDTAVLLELARTRQERRAATESLERARFYDEHTTW